VSKELNREPTPEPIESEEERVARETQENEAGYVGVQALVRGVLVRERARGVRWRLARAERGVLGVQSAVRGGLVRAVFAQHLREYRETAEWITQVPSIGDHTDGRYKLRPGEFWCELRLGRSVGNWDARSRFSLRCSRAFGGSF
jgi:Ras GTPase-activating-like protein IQGAP2/3